jgi:hypothetical protein
LDVIPLPIFINKKPVLFASVLASDMDGPADEVLMTFDGKKYVINEGNKVILD